MVVCGELCNCDGRSGGGHVGVSGFTNAMRHRRSVDKGGRVFLLIFSKTIYFFCFTIIHEVTHTQAMVFSIMSQ